MFPPKSPGQSPLNASWPRGATATRPSIGLRSISMVGMRGESGNVVRPIMRVVSSSQR